MEIISFTHPHHYRNRFLLNSGGKGGGGSFSSSSNFQLPDWFYKDEEGNVHSKYPFVGDSEVSAYGKGNSQGEGGSSSTSKIVINGKAINEIVQGDNIYIDTDSEEGKAIINSTGGGGSSEGDSTTGPYLPLSGGTLTGHLLLGDGSTTTFKKVETIRNVNGVPNGAAFYTNSDGTAAFFHKTYSSTTLGGDVNDAILKFDHNGLYFAKGATDRTAATDFKEVLTEETAYKKDQVFTKSETSAFTESTYQKIGDYALKSELHNHNNKAELDLIKTGDVTKWDLTTTNFNDWFYRDKDGVVHSKYSFAGDSEVSAYGTGSTQGGGSTGGGYITVNGRNINSIKNANHITFGGSGSELVIGDNIDLSNYLTKASGDTLYQPKGDYLTQQSLTDYAKKTDLHSHNNKEVLDKLTQNVIDNSHTHSNKSVLDGITSTKVGNWDTAYTNNHTHSNKSVLDGITSAKVNQWDSGYTYGISAYTDLNEWFYKDASGNIHSKYPFVGDSEVSAYGKGNSQGGGTTGGGFITVNGTNINALEAGDNINISTNNGTAKISASLPSLSGYLTKSSGDTLYQPKGDYALKTDLHSHSNKSVLDGITSTKVSNWDAAYTDKHTHSNKSELDLVKTGDVAKWDLTTTNFNDWFYKDTNGNIHSKYNFVGDNEVSAYGTGSTQGGGSTGGGTIKVGTSNINELSGAGGTSISVSGTKATISSHTHSNKSVLDGITSGKTSNWDAAYTDKHTHTNKTALDTITTGKTSNWDTAYTNNHTHSNKSVLDGITSAKVSNWDAAYSDKHTHTNKSILDKLTQNVIDNSHTHSNKSVLDGITSGKVTNWDSVYSDFNDWFYKDTNGVVHSKYSFAGDSEVSAYGTGSTTASGGGTIKVGTSNINELSGAGGTSISVSGTKATISSHTHSNLSNLESNYISGITVNNKSYTPTNHKITLPNYPTKVSELTNDSGYLTQHQSLTDYAKKTDLHSHSNKSVLDGITSTKVGNWDTAYTNNHTHSNKSVLDGITSGKVTNWDNAYTWYSNSATTINTAVNNFNDWFYKDTNGNIHSKYNFVGDKEVSAYGKGDSQGSGVGGGTIKVGTTNINELSGAGGTSISVSGTKATISSHTHSNKSVLDGITSGKTSNWDAAYTNNHTHSNKSVLDGITSTKINHWDNAYEDSHSHTNKSVLDNLTQTVINNSHTHSNKSALDQISSTNVSNWSDAYGWMAENASDISDALDWIDDNEKRLKEYTYTCQSTKYYVNICNLTVSLSSATVDCNEIVINLVGRAGNGKYIIKVNKITQNVKPTVSFTVIGDNIVNLYYKNVTTVSNSDMTYQVWAEMGINSISRWNIELNEGWTVNEPSGTTYLKTSLPTLGTALNAWKRYSPEIRVQTNGIIGAKQISLEGGAGTIKIDEQYGEDLILDANGVVKVNTELSVDNDLTTEGSATIKSNMNVSGNTNIRGNLIVDGYILSKKEVSAYDTSTANAKLSQITTELAKVEKYANATTTTQSMTLANNLLAIMKNISTILKS